MYPLLKKGGLDDKPRNILALIESRIGRKFSLGVSLSIFNVVHRVSGSISNQTTLCNIQISFVFMKDMVGLMSIKHPFVSNKIDYH